MLGTAFVIFTVISTLLPFTITKVLTTFFRPTTQFFQLTKSFTLLLLGMTLSTLATLNFSLAFIVGLLAAPVTFVQPTKSVPLRLAQAAVLNLVAPTSVISCAARYAGLEVAEVLKQASFGWNVWGMYTPVVLWCVWWPAWLLGAVNAVGDTVS